MGPVPAVSVLVLGIVVPVLSGYIEVRHDPCSEAKTESSENPLCSDLIVCGFSCLPRCFLRFFYLGPELGLDSPAVTGSLRLSEILNVGGSGALPAVCFHSPLSFKNSCFAAEITGDFPPAVDQKYGSDPVFRVQTGGVNLLRTSR